MHNKHEFAVTDAAGNEYAEDAIKDSKTGKYVLAYDYVNDTNALPSYALQNIWLAIASMHTRFQQMDLLMSMYMLML